MNGTPNPRWYAHILRRWDICNMHTNSRLLSNTIFSDLQGKWYTRLYEIMEGKEELIPPCIARVTSSSMWNDNTKEEFSKENIEKIERERGQCNVRKGGEATSATSPQHQLFEVEMRLDIGFDTINRFCGRIILLHFSFFNNRVLFYRDNTMIMAVNINVKYTTIVFHGELGR